MPEMILGAFIVLRRFLFVTPLPMLYPLAFSISYARKMILLSAAVPIFFSTSRRTNPHAFFGKAIMRSSIRSIRSGYLISSIHAIFKLLSAFASDWLAFQAVELGADRIAPNG